MHNNQRKVGETVYSKAAYMSELEVILRVFIFSRVKYQHTENELFFGKWKAHKTVCKNVLVMQYQTVLTDNNHTMPPCLMHHSTAPLLHILPICEKDNKIKGM